MSISNVYLKDTAKGKHTIQRFLLGTVFVYQMLCGIVLNMGWNHAAEYMHFAEQRKLLAIEEWHDSFVRPNAKIKVSIPL
jgi:hypothetical protein